MPNTRKTGGRAELDAAWTQINAILADYTSGRTGLLAAIRRVNTALLDRQKLGAIIADLGVLRTPVVALITDIGATRAEVVKLVTDITSLLARFNGGLTGRVPLAALIADLGAIRTKLLAAGADNVSQTRRLDTRPGRRLPLAAIIADLGAIRTPTNALVTDLTALLARFNCLCLTQAGIANGSTAGCLRIQTVVDFFVGGSLCMKPNTDDLWDLSAEIDTDGTHYRAYWLYLNAAGTASFAAGSDELSANAALAALPALAADKSVIGVYVAGLSTDFNAVGGLAAQGTIYNGFPAALAKTASAAAAITTSATTGIGDGTTKGALRTTAETEYQIFGEQYIKAATDDLWDLSAEVDTDGTHYRAYWLYLDSAGTASFAAGSDETSSNAAIAALPAESATKCPIGYYVAGLSTDFNGAAGLAAQGVIHNGRPASVLTYADPAAITATVNLGLADGSTAGFLKTQADSEFQVAGAFYRKAATDDLWDLSAEVDTIAGKYRAYWLYANAAGTASFAASATDEDSEAAALAALPTLDAAKAVLGVYVAGPSTDFDGVAGLSAQGTLYNGYPAALAKTAVAPAAITASSPAAISTNTTLAIGNGGTAGRLRTNADLEYMISGIVYRKATTDDLWDLHSETDTTGVQYRAYWLYLDSAGTATYAAGSNAASAAAAIAALPAETATKCPVGVFVAGLSCDFDAGGGLAAQGTLYDGRAAAVSDPSALTAETTTLIHS